MVGGKALPLEPDILTDEADPKPLAKETEPEAVPRQRRARTAAPAAPKTRSVPYNFGKVQGGIARGLRAVNVVLSTNPITKGDRFDDVEVLMISATVAAQAEQDLWLRKLVMTGLENGGRLSVVGLVAVIIARRAARHGILPPDFDYEVGQLLNQTLAGVSESVPPPMPEPGLEATPSEAAPDGGG